MGPPPTQMWVKAQAAVDARDCPRCGRARGERCRNLRNAPYKAVRELPLPHAERYEESG